MDAPRRRPPNSHHTGHVFERFLRLSFSVTLRSFRRRATTSPRCSCVIHPVARATTW